MAGTATIVGGAKVTLSLDPAEYATLLGGIGFNIVAHVVEDPQAGGRTVWLAQSRE